MLLAHEIDKLLTNDQVKIHPYTIKMHSIHRILYPYKLLNLLVALHLIPIAFVDGYGRICIIFRADQGLIQHSYLSLRTLVINSCCVGHC